MLRIYHSYGGKKEKKHNQDAVQGLQKYQLLVNEGKNRRDGQKTGTRQILQALPKTHIPQGREEIIHLGAKAPPGMGGQT